MNYQEKYCINSDNVAFFSKQFDILITGRREADARHSYFRNSLVNFEGLIYSFDTCDRADSFYYKIENFSGEIINEVKNKSLIPDLQKLLKADNFKGAKICIDITTLKQGILFLLIKLLITEYQPARLFAAYTEPKEYKRRTYSDVGETEEFDLYDRIIGNSIGVPGFIKRQSANNVLLIAPMGFDSQRLQTIYENLKPKKIIPVVGFPSFAPGWNITAIKANYLILKSAECFDLVKTCESASPFKLYSLLEEIFHRYNGDYDIYISPLGTRPHCLGAAIFATKYSSSYLIYDFPVEKKYRSNEILKVDLFNITKFIY